MITTKIMLYSKYSPTLKGRDIKIATTTEHRGSKEYQDLLAKGYQEVATVKSTITESWGQQVKTFIDPNFFEPKDKYPKNQVKN